MPAEGRIRLDAALVRAGLASTRSRARDMVLRGTVRLGGVLAAKPGLLVAADAVLSADDPAAAYVSRGALKLAAGLDAFGFDPAGRIALDLGASTGGFTQVLLERGAERVFAVDVGHDQLDPRLAADPRVMSHERLNARDLERSHLGDARVTALVADVSFIPLTVALAPALDLVAAGAWAVLLVKPQFELGREALGKDGVVRDPQAPEAAADRVAAWLDGRSGWRVTGRIASPLAGGDGNREFLLGAQKTVR